MASHSTYTSAALTVLYNVRKRAYLCPPESANSSWPEYERGGTVVISRMFLVAVGVWFAVASTASADARRVRLNVISQPVSQVVETLTFMTGIPVTHVGTLNGTIENWTVDSSGVEAFRALGEAANLFVAFDGTRMVISPKSEMNTVVLERRARSWVVARNAVRALFPMYPEAAIQHDPTSDVLIVRGPPAFVSAIETVLNRSMEKTVRVFKGGVAEVVTVQSTSAAN